MAQALQLLKEMNNIHYILLAGMLVFLHPVTSTAQELNASDIRTELDKAALNEQAAWQLVEKLNKHSTNSATITALKASATGLLCVHTNNPVKLMKYSKEALKIADEAIAMDEQNLEARFARFAIQSQIPGVLGLSKNMEEDRRFFNNHFKKENFGDIPFQSLEAMIHLFDESDEFSNSEILSMKAELYSYY